MFFPQNFQINVFKMQQYFNIHIFYIEMYYIQY